MIKKIKIIISLLVIVMMMVILFHFSNESYQQQSLIPTLNRLLANEPFAALLSHIEFTYAGRIISIEQVGYSHFIEFFIRKFAHFSSYFIIGCFTFLLLKQLIANIKVTFCLAWLIPILYAVIDEIHQSFTPGRTPLWQDVFLDSLGALVGIIVGYIFSRYKKKYYNIGR